MFAGFLEIRDRFFSSLGYCVILASLLIISSASTAWSQTYKGQRIACDNGAADKYECSEVDMLSKLDMADYGATFANDVWGWTDPQTNKEYVLAGHWDGVAFVDISDPINPVYLGYLPTRQDANAIWRDIKVYKDHAFVVVDGGGSNGMQIFDLTELRTPPDEPGAFSETAHYGVISTAHNVFIHEDTGFAYIVGARDAAGSEGEAGTGCNKGLHIVDISDPVNPVFAGCFNDTNTGRNKDGYTHDVQCVTYIGPDADYQNKEICIGSNETHLSVADVTDKWDTKVISSATYPTASYIHQGWFSEDQTYFYMNDEGDETSSGGSFTGARTIVWDLEDLDDPIVDSYYMSPKLTVDHNLYVVGKHVMMANYTSGLRVVNISDPANPKEVGYFDTHPSDDNINYNGAWSVYPFFDSGVLAVSSYPEGLFMLEFVGQKSSAAETDEIPDGFTLSAAYPNPFNPSTSLILSLSEGGPVDVKVYDMAGRELAQLASGTLSAGDHVLHFDSGDLSSGTYMIVATVADRVQSQSVTLVK